MAKVKTVHICSECGWESPKWVGQCRGCQSWSTMEETLSAPNPGQSVAAPAPASRPSPPVRLDQVGVDEAAAVPTGIAEFDRVLGGGIVPGSVILLAGEPGVGKSTLLLDVAARYARLSAAEGKGPVLYVTGEESAAQVRRRAERISALAPTLLLAAETDVANAIWHMQESGVSLLIVDSVQTLTTTMVDGQPGSVGQVKAVASLIIHAAKQAGIPAIVVGHVTKEGTLAGPRTLEHLVDVVCQFEGDRTSTLRLLRASKNRYGSTEEVGCFVLDEAGIQQVEDPSMLFTSGSKGEARGSFVTVTMEGQRPLVTEVQALTADGSGGSPRRATSGVDYSRVAMLLAVIQEHLKYKALARKDVYVSTVGGGKTVEPATDLALALAITSATAGRYPLRGTVAFGEVGLTGEIRGVSNLSRRLAEARRLGWSRAIVPASQRPDVKIPKDMDVIGVVTLEDSLRHALTSEHLSGRNGSSR